MGSGVRPVSWRLRVSGGWRAEVSRPSLYSGSGRGRSRTGRPLKATRAELPGTREPRPGHWPWSCLLSLSQDAELSPKAWARLLTLSIWLLGLGAKPTQTPILGKACQLGQGARPSATQLPGPARAGEGWSRCPGLTDGSRRPSSRTQVAPGPQVRGASTEQGPQDPCTPGLCP